MSRSILGMAMSVALEAIYPATETWVTTLGTTRMVLETERAQTSTAMTTTTRWSLDAEFVEEVVDADIAEADAEDEDEGEAAVEVDEAGDMGGEFDLVRVVEKVAEWLGKRLVVDGHVLACQDADKGAGEETDLCTVTEMAKAEQAQSSSL